MTKKTVANKKQSNSIHLDYNIVTTSGSGTLVIPVFLVMEYHDIGTIAPKDTGLFDAVIAVNVSTYRGQNPLVEKETLLCAKNVIENLLKKIDGKGNGSVNTKTGNTKDTGSRSSSHRGSQRKK